MDNGKVKTRERGSAEKDWMQCHIIQIVVATAQLLKMTYCQKSSCKVIKSCEIRRGTLKVSGEPTRKLEGRKWVSTLEGRKCNRKAKPDMYAPVPAHSRLEDMLIPKLQLANLCIGV